MGLFHILKQFSSSVGAVGQTVRLARRRLGVWRRILSPLHISRRHVGYNSCRYLRHILSSKQILSPATICADIDPSFLGLKGRQFIFNFELPNFIHSINFIYNKPVKQLWQQTFIACSVYDLKETYPKLQGICINRNFNDLDIEIIHFIPETEFNNYVSLVK